MEFEAGKGQTDEKRQGQQGQEAEPRRGRGRPKGRKNDKTLVKEAMIALGLIEVPKPRPRGRPPGRKDDWTLYKEAREAAGNPLSEEELSQRPKRGRPKGLKKQKGELPEGSQALVKGGAPQEGQKHRGRPKGRKNQKTLLKEAQKELSPSEGENKEGED